MIAMPTKDNTDLSTDVDQTRPTTNEKLAVTSDEDASQAQSPVKLGLLLVALCLAVLCQALDNTIITTAIPKITDEFDSLDDVGWYGSVY